MCTIYFYQKIWLQSTALFFIIELWVSTNTFYICYISSRFCKSDAPDGHDNWYVYVKTPVISGQDWEQIGADIKELVLERISRFVGEDVRSQISYEKMFTPPFFSKFTHAHQGAVFGANSHGAFSVLRRHPNFSKKVKGLFFCGGTVHPGPGVPLAILSAKIATDLVPNV